MEGKIDLLVIAGVMPEAKKAVEGLSAFDLFSGISLGCCFRF